MSSTRVFEELRDAQNYTSFPSEGAISPVSSLTDLGFVEAADGEKAEINPQEERKKQECAGEGDYYAFPEPEASSVDFELGLLPGSDNSCYSNPGPDDSQYRMPLIHILEILRTFPFELSGINHKEIDGKPYPKSAANVIEAIRLTLLRPMDIVDLAQMIQKIREEFTHKTQPTTFLGLFYIRYPSTAKCYKNILDNLPNVQITLTPKEQKILAEIEQQRSTVYYSA